MVIECRERPTRSLCDTMLVAPLGNTTSSPLLGATFPDQLPVVLQLWSAPAPVQVSVAEARAASGAWDNIIPRPTASPSRREATRFEDMSKSLACGTGIGNRPR